MGTSWLVLICLFKFVVFLLHVHFDLLQPAGKPIKIAASKHSEFGWFPLAAASSAAGHAEMADLLTAAHVVLLPTVAAPAATLVVPVALVTSLAPEAVVTVAAKVVEDARHDRGDPDSAIQSDAALPAQVVANAPATPLFWGDVLPSVPPPSDGTTDQVMARALMMMQQQDQQFQQVLHFQQQQHQQQQQQQQQPQLQMQQWSLPQYPSNPGNLSI